MLTAESINSQIYNTVNAQVRTYPCNNLRASNLGHPCERYLYLLIKHWDEQKPHDVGLQNIFNLGNSIEEYAIKMIKEAGYEIITPTQRSWKIDNPLITGREDIRIKDPEDGQLYPAEIKGLSPFDWDKLHTVDDFYRSKKSHIRAYPAQLQTYMYHFNKEKGFFVIVNKLTGELRVIEMPFNWDYADELLKKGERIYKALSDKTGKSLPEATTDFSMCERCSLAHICTASATRLPMEFDDGNLADIIDRKNELAPYFREYNEVNDLLKKAVGERENILAGDYIVTSKLIHRKSYVVAEREERRISIKRI